MSWNILWNRQTKLYKTSRHIYVGKKRVHYFSSLNGNERYEGKRKKNEKEKEFYSFGFQKVSEEIKRKLVNNLFTNVANKYDLMNDLMSLRLHRCWKKQMVKELDIFLKYHTFNMLENINKYSKQNNEYQKNEYEFEKEEEEEEEEKEEKEPKIKTEIETATETEIDIETETISTKDTKEKRKKKKKRDEFYKCKILDLAGGTGDIAFQILKRVQFYLSKYNDKGYFINPNNVINYYPQIIVCDPNIDMINEGKKKAEHLNFHNSIIWLNEQSENLKSIENDSIDIVTVSFGIRNFTDLSISLNEIYRVLKPGGRFLCLEFMNLKNYNYLNTFYKFYLNNVIPCLGAIVANNKDAYKYLSESIQVFLTPQELSKLIYQAHFRNVHYTTLTCGIVAIHSAYKRT